MALSEKRDFPKLFGRDLPPFCERATSRLRGVKVPLLRAKQYSILSYGMQVHLQTFTRESPYTVPLYIVLGSRRPAAHEPGSCADTCLSCRCTVQYRRLRYYCRRHHRQLQVEAIPVITGALPAPKNRSHPLARLAVGCCGSRHARKPRPQAQAGGRLAGTIQGPNNERRVKYDHRPPHSHQLTGFVAQGLSHFESNRLQIDRSRVRFTPEPRYGELLPLLSQRI
jgi:hypothetical protein